VKKILPISLKLNFTPNTLGCKGLNGKPRQKSCIEFFPLPDTLERRFVTKHADAEGHNAAMAPEVAVVALRGAAGSCTASRGQLAKVESPLQLSQYLCVLNNYYRE